MAKEVYTVRITRNTTIKGVPVPAGKVVSIGDIIEENKQTKAKTQVDEGDIKTLLSLNRAVEAEPAEESAEEESSPKGKGKGR